MEIIVAFGIPKGSPFLASSAFMDLASTSAISIRLVAIIAIITEALISWAVLPADGTETGVSIFTVRVAQSTNLLFIILAGGERLASCAAVSFLPARVRHISVMVVGMVVMNRCAVVVLLGVGERISNIVRGEVWHMMGVLIDMNRCMNIFIHVMSRNGILIIVVNMSLVNGLMYDSRLVINFMCHDGLMVDFMSNDGLVVDFMSNDGLVVNFMCHNRLLNDFMCNDMCVLWRRILCC